ncbi:DUF192 domain-containing protein [Mongoliimonas terrestris]|uniref:DUF192 domain-containing protein n=1 Tax=Mongoliimonas terrestris TaxID=1709001 RepID=UPI0009494E99|nr:DUF192 domain-containing protein [Mongoliimonas terrestris]
MRSFVHSCLVAVALAAAPLSATVEVRAEGTPEQPAASLSRLTVETASGLHAYDVELAVTPAERSRGLMYRKSLAADRGMLFDMGVAGPAAFWMRNTFVSLDIIFIGADGRVLNVGARTTPLSEATVPSDGDARFVLELVAGQADAIGLKRGDRVRHPIIDAIAGP